jgi:hypothetical protein
MKNIHILPTDKPSSLYYKDNNYKLANSTMAMDWYISSAGYKPTNIYITSEEEIKVGDWIYNEEREPSVMRCIDKGSLRGWRKIILTTDQDLIKDGVQVIDDEFLEWFVKNPSCEWVEIIDDTFTVGEMSKLPLGTRNHKYKIIIPKEKQKQHLIDMMRDDENLGLYEESKLSAVETIQSEVIEIQSEMIEKYKKITELDKEHIFYLENLIQTQEKLISNLKHQVELLEKLYL